jgi:hypothetical protein
LVDPDRTASLTLHSERSCRRQERKGGRASSFTLTDLPSRISVLTVFGAIN